MTTELKSENHRSVYYCIVKGCTNKPLGHVGRCKKHYEEILQ